MGVLGLVGVDEEGFYAVAFLDVAFWDSGLEIEDCVAVWGGLVDVAESWRDGGVLTHLDGKLSKYDQFLHPKGGDVVLVFRFHVAIPRIGLR